MALRQEKLFSENVNKHTMALNIGRPKRRLYQDKLIFQAFQIRPLPLPGSENARLVEFYRGYFRDMLIFRQDVKNVVNEIWRPHVTNMNTLAGLVYAYNVSHVLEHRTCDEAMDDLGFLTETELSIRTLRPNDPPESRMQELIRRARTERKINLLEPAWLIQELRRQNFDASKMMEMYKGAKAMMELASQSFHWTRAQKMYLEYCIDSRRWLYVPFLLRDLDEIYSSMEDLLHNARRFKKGQCDTYLVAVLKKDGERPAAPLMTTTLWPYPDKPAMQEHSLTAANLREMITNPNRPKNLALTLHAYAGEVGARQYIAVNPLGVMRKIYLQANALRGLPFQRVVAPQSRDEPKYKILNNEWLRRFLTTPQRYASLAAQATEAAIAAAAGTASATTDPLTFDVTIIRPFLGHSEDQWNYFAHLVAYVDHAIYLYRSVLEQSNIELFLFDSVGTILYRYETECVDEDRTCEEAIGDLQFLYTKATASSDKETRSRDLGEAARMRGITIRPEVFQEIMSLPGFKGYVPILKSINDDMWKAVQLTVNKLRATTTFEDTHILNYCFNASRWIYVLNVLRETRNSYILMQSYLNEQKPSTLRVSPDDCVAQLIEAKVHNTVLMTLACWNDSPIHEQVAIAPNIRLLVQGYPMDEVYHALQSFAGSVNLFCEYIVCPATGRVGKLIRKAVHMGCLQPKDIPADVQVKCRQSLGKTTYAFANNFDFRERCPAPDR